MSHGQRTASAAYWSVLDAVAKSVLQFSISLVLARLLAPEEFGTVAILGVFTGMAMVLTDGGFGAALIQRTVITEEDTASVFYLNLLIALIMAALLCVSARWIAEYFRRAILEQLTYLMAVNLLVAATGSIQTVLLTRELDFRTQTHVSIVATLVSGVACIALAYQGFGVWSLAIRILAFSLVSTSLLWYRSTWKPVLTFSFAALRSLFSFGSYLLGSQLLSALYDRVTALVIGSAYSAADLGQYSRAEGTQQMPASVLTMVLNRVAFPIFSSANADKARLKRGVRTSIGLLMLINLPLMLGMAVLSEPLTIFLYGITWAPSSRFLQILCLAGAIWPLHVIHLSVLRAQGHSRIFFWMEVAKRAIGIVTLVLAATISIEAMAWSQVLFSYVCYFINSYYTGVFLQYSLVEQARDLLPYAGVTGLMTGVIGLVAGASPADPALRLTLLTGLGAAIYLGAAHALRLPGYVTLRGLVANAWPASCAH